MAEAAGLALGAISLSGLLSTCIELADYISLARNVGSDYEISYTKFLLLRSRLSSSGQQLCSTFEMYADNDARNWYKNATIRNLIAIKDLLGDVQKLQEKYGLRQEGDGDDMLIELQSHHSSTLQEIESLLKASAERRQRKTPLGRKIVWAIRDKKAFDGLLSDLAFHIDEQEKFIIRLGGYNLQQTLPTLSPNVSTPAIRLLDLASSGPDVTSLGRVENNEHCEGSASDGHLYLRNQIKEHAKVLLGDVGGKDHQGRRHVFTDNAISGQATVIQGNVPPGFMDSFWSN